MSFRSQLLRLVLCGAAAHLTAACGGGDPEGQQPGSFNERARALEVTPPVTIWPSTAAPTNSSWPDSGAVNLGVKFRSDQSGSITGIRFYKGAQNTGTHIGSLWSATGALLATATFSGETATGWQQVNFSSPVAIAANTVYVASYLAPSGGYAVDLGYFSATGVDNVPLHALQNGVSGGNGVYAYGAANAFPANASNGHNFWVDVVFTATSGPDTIPPTVTTTTPPSGATGVATSSTVTATFSEAMDAATIGTGTFELRNSANALVPATVTYNAATLVATLTPNAALATSATYTATVKGGTTDPRVKDIAGNALAANRTWSFTTAAPASGCVSPANAIVAENCLAGNPQSEWDVAGSGDASIQGYATQMSVNRGSTVFFKVNTTVAGYRFDIYRLGYYGGLGARKITTVLPSVTLPQVQPGCLNDGATGLVDCGNWAVSGSWAIPPNAASGIYIARLVRSDTGGASHIVFVVRDDAGGSDLLFQTPDTTWQAYNDYGGNSLYSGSPAGRAYKVSYNRPFNNRGNQYRRAWLFDSVYPMIRWTEANGYNVSYISGIDTERSGNLLLNNHRAFLSVGHDEYWSAAQRANVEAARNSGVNLAFFSGNEIFWKTRWEPSIDGTATAYRTLVSYKETTASAKIDPTPIWTGTWRDPRFSPPSDGGRPENSLSGTIFTVNCCDSNTPGIQVPSAYRGLRFWRNTDIATLATGQVAVLARGTLGYEWDEDLDNGSRPPGLIRMSSTTISGVPLLQDFGSTYASGTATHSLTMYRHASGALVFGAGTIRWSWGLDATHDLDPATPNGATTPDVRVQQATVNLLADMRTQPGTLQPGLIASTASTDVVAPSSTIASPSGGSVVPVGSLVTVSGTASDSGGGVVGGVEVSVDGGATWRRAEGTTAWTYAWAPNVTGSVTIKSRSTDDSGNIEMPSGGMVVTVTQATGQSTIWPGTTVPATPASGDTGAVELGVKFQSSTSGRITGIRFYKGAGNGGTHVGNLWTAGGVLLASATFAGETATGWQQVNFASPVAINAGTTYVASYFAPQGRYAFNANYFATAVTSGPLTALATGTSGGNGVYRYGAASSFPTSTYNANNYWVDVVFVP